MRLFYTVMFTLLLPVIFLNKLWRSRLAPAYRSRLWERFGVFQGPAQKGGVWFHTVSVGEFLAAAPLIEQFMAAHPGTPVTVTTTTPTGSEQVRKHFADRVFHVYLPYDIPVFLSAFFWRVRPELLVILETELWPNLLHTAKRFRCPTYLVNARLSERSARGYGKVSGLTKTMLQQLDQLCVQSTADAERFRALGMDPARMSITGSIKFDVAIPDTMNAQAEALRRQWHLPLGSTEQSPRPVWILASSHEGEDEIALRAHQAVMQAFPNSLLLIVPRHPERFAKVAELVEKSHFTLGLRSQFKNVNAQTQVLVVDTMGELVPFLAASDVVCMGGSFIESGGHNPLEPAALGKATLIGPSQFNFEQICQLMFEAGGLIAVDDAQTLADTVIRCFQEPAFKARVGQQALSVVEANRGAQQAIFELISRQF